MSRFLLIPILLLSVLLTSCGQVFVGFVSNPGNPARISGTITTVEVGFVSGGAGTWVTITSVTFVNIGTFTTINFCGDQRSRFRVNQFVQADFRTGNDCATLTGVSNRIERSTHW